MKINIVLNRIRMANYTAGIMELPDGWTCCTLELPYLDNENDISCCPEGTYTYAFRESPSNGLVLELKNVTSRKNIQIHVGNWLKNTLGCILVGRTFNPNHANGPMVTSSGPTMKDLLSRVPKRGIIHIK